MTVIVCLSRGPVLTTKPGDTLSHPASSETLRIMRPDPRFHAVSVDSGWLCSALETSNSTAPVEIPMPLGVAVAVGVGVGVEGAGRGLCRSIGLTGVGSGTSSSALRVTTTV